MNWGAAVEFSGPDDPLPVKCRVKATERAIRNLLENATKYGDQARTTLFRAGDMAVLWIDDEGPGIPEDMLDQVFAPFQRLAEDTGGSGLGLAIARTIAVDQGGTVRLEKPTGRWITCRVSLACVSMMYRLVGTRAWAKLFLARTSSRKRRDVVG